MPAAFLVGPGDGIASSGRASNRGRRAADQGLQRERQKEQAEGEEAERQAYRQFLDQALVHSSTKLPSGELQQITASVEKKLSMLRTALSEARFREAVEGCVREELVKLLGLPDIVSWRRTNR